MTNYHWIGIAAAVVLAGCTEEPEVDGRMAFVENCAVCHGSEGRGNGPAAEGLTPAPADLTRIAARNGGDFPFERVMSTIDGYRAGSHSPMPEFGAGDLGPTVTVELTPGVGTPVPATLLALGEYLRSIQE